MQMAILMSIQRTSIPPESQSSKKRAPPRDDSI
jgi:hypothetical protein